MSYGVYLPDSIDHTELKADSVRSSEIQASAVEAAEIASNAVTTAKILDANVTLAKVENVTSAQIIVGNGSNRPTAVAVSGDIGLSNAGVATIQANAVEGTMLNTNVADTSTIEVSSNTLSVLKVPNALTAGTGLSAGGTFDGANARSFAVAAAQTTITSIINDSMTKVGRAGAGGLNDLVDFQTAGSVIIKTDDTARLTVSDASVAVSNDLVVTGNLTVNGTTTTVDTTNLLVKDKLITINDGGGANSADGAGIEFEENGSAAGFIKVAADRAGFEFQAPGNNNTLTIDATAASTITVAGNAALNQDVQSTASPAFAGLSLAGGAADISILDNNAAALEIKEAGNAYMTFDTQNGAEKIIVSKTLDIDAASVDCSTQATAFMMKDNTNDCIEFKEGSNIYLAFDSTDGSEKIKVSKSMQFMGASLNITVDDNQADALSFDAGGKADMIKFVTTNSKESLHYSAGTCYVPQNVSAGGSSPFSVANATAILAGFTVIMVASDSADKGVKLPAAADLTVGQYMMIINAGAQSFKLYGEDADATISGEASLVIPANGSVGCVLADATNGQEKWIAI